MAGIGVGVCALIRICPGEIHTVISIRIAGIGVGIRSIGGRIQRRIASVGRLPVLIQREYIFIGGSAVHRTVRICNGSGGRCEAARVVAQILTGVEIKLQSCLTIVLSLCLIVEESDMGHLKLCATGQASVTAIILIYVAKVDGRTGKAITLIVMVGIIRLQINGNRFPAARVGKHRNRRRSAPAAVAVNQRNRKVLSAVHSGGTINNCNIAQIFILVGLAKIFRKVCHCEVTIGARTAGLHPQIPRGLVVHRIDIGPLDHSGAVDIRLVCSLKQRSGAGKVRTDLSCHGGHAAAVRHSIGLRIRAARGHTGAAVLGVVPLEEHTVIQIVINLDGPVDGILLFQRIDVDTGFHRLQFAESYRPGLQRHDLKRHNDHQHHGQDSHG